MLMLDTICLLKSGFPKVLTHLRDDVSISENCYLDNLASHHLNLELLRTIWHHEIC